MAEVEEKPRNDETLEFSREKTRVEVLATHKKSKATFWTTFGPKMIWGNQDPMWPISPTALKVVPTSRLKELSRPKSSHRSEEAYIPEFVYSCGRTSKIWLVGSAAKNATSSGRVRTLARHKTSPAGYLEHRPQFQYSCGRCSAVWSVSELAKRCSHRPRTASLALPKRTPLEYEPCRPTIQTIVPSSAKTYTATATIESLAAPKQRIDGPFRDPQWVVSESTKQVNASDRVVELSKAKKLSDGYQSCRNVVWRVNAAAKNATASSRMEELSRPIIRETMDHVQFNPDAFEVSTSAKKYKATGRIEELAKPILR